MDNYLFTDVPLPLICCFILECQGLTFSFLFIHMLFENLMSGQEKNKSYFYMGRKSGIEMHLLQSLSGRLLITRLHIDYWLHVDFSQLLLLIFECSGVCRDWCVFWCLVHASVCFLGAVMDSKVIVPLTVFYPLKCVCFTMWWNMFVLSLLLQFVSYTPSPICLILLFSFLQLSF